MANGGSTVGRALKYWLQLRSNCAWYLEKIEERLRPWIKSVDAGVVTVLALAP